MKARSDVQGRTYRMFAAAVAVALVLAACGVGAVDAPVEVIEETTTNTGGRADIIHAVEAAPDEPVIASVPIMEPTAEIAIGPHMKDMALAPDGTLLAVAGGGLVVGVDAFLRIYDTTNGGLVFELSLDGIPAPGQVFWTADNRLLSIDFVSFDNTVTTWDATTFEVVDAYVAESIRCLTGVKGFDPVAGTLFAHHDFGGDTTLCRRQLDADILLTEQPFGDNPFNFMSLRPDGSALLVELYDRARDENILVELDPTTLEVVGETSLALDSVVGVGNDQHLVSEININSSDMTYTLQPSGVELWTGNMGRASFSPDGALVWALNRTDNIEMLFDLASGEPVGQFEVGRGGVFHAWSADGSVLAIPTLDDAIKIFRP